MKVKYLIGFVFLIGFAILALNSFDESKVGYGDFDVAGSQNKVIQVVGTWEKSQPVEYNSENNTFTFYMNDDKENTLKIVHSGSKPNNFELADKIVVKGKLDGDVFHSNQILTKCPSKYEGTAEQLKNS